MNKLDEHVELMRAYIEIKQRDKRKKNRVPPSVSSLRSKQSKLMSKERRRLELEELAILREENELLRAEIERLEKEEITDEYIKPNEQNSTDRPILNRTSEPKTTTQSYLQSLKQRLNQPTGHKQQSLRSG